ncbi:MAG: hypothetical protein CHACPFDD_03449 [Phycisphaerae bacterium]|nr:hypothetical protein [Phycisphaerae bacterium]
MAAISEANRLGLDYRRPPAARVDVPIIDVHTHVQLVQHAPKYFEAARLYGVRRTLSMTPLAEVDDIRREFGERIEFIAIPNWRKFEKTATFARQWMDDLEAFRARGARLCKFWMAPRMRERLRLTLDDAWVREVVRHAHGLGYDFMVHIADPTVWWSRQYADTAVFGTKTDQYAQLRHLLTDFGDRLVIGAHMGGCVEELDFLSELLERHPNYVIDTSATKWIVREVARQPEAVRAFVTHYASRVLFGSDLVVGDKYDFDHYASRYWAQRMMWESDYRGESPIDDPDASQPPQLAGVALPADILAQVYHHNAVRLLGIDV